MSRLEMIRATWLRQSIKALQDAQKTQFTMDRANAISTLKAELNKLISYK